MKSIHKCIYYYQEVSYKQYGSLGHSFVFLLTNPLFRIPLCANKTNKNSTLICVDIPFIILVKTCFIQYPTFLYWKGTIGLSKREYIFHKRKPESWGLLKQNEAWICKDHVLIIFKRVSFYPLSQYIFWIFVVIVILLLLEYDRYVR